MSNNKTHATDNMPDFTGRVINHGQYQLTQVLGSGAYGVVYRAVDLVSPSSSKTSTKQLAIKVLSKKAMTKRTKIHVRREVTFHAQMSQHPNVVTMHRAFEDRDYVYIVLDYCPGGDLFGKISDEREYFKKDELVKKLFLQLLDAVHACHRKSIFHRDLKPENVLVSEDGTELYLSDFGLSTNNQVSETFGCGSSYYMSPECIGKECGFLAYSNRASDVWALGVVLVNMVTCRSPWSKAVTMDDCFSDFLLDENYLREMLPISKEANSLFRKIFTYDPIDRITLIELRKAIVELDTFFMSDADIARAGPAVRIAASYCGHKLPAAKPVANGNGRIAKHAPRSPAAHFADTPAVSPITTTDAFIIGSLSSTETWSDASDSSATISSGSESDGPMTPSTIAQDPEIEIPEFNIELKDDDVAEVKRDVESKAPHGLRVINVTPVATLTA